MMNVMPICLARTVWMGGYKYCKLRYTDIDRVAFELAEAIGRMGNGIYPLWKMLLSRRVPENKLLFFRNLPEKNFFNLINIRILRCSDGSESVRSGKVS